MLLDPVREAEHGQVAHLVGVLAGERKGVRLPAPADFGWQVAHRVAQGTTDRGVDCLRIGHVVTEDRPLTVRDFSVWCSQRDIARMIGRALEAPEGLRFDVFFVASDNRWGYRDLAHPREVLGWSPLDRAEDFR